MIRRRQSAAAIRRRNQNILGAFYIATGLFVSVVWLATAYAIDKSNGINVAQSLALWGM